jgi:hypothetical protein
MRKTISKMWMMRKSTAKFLAAVQEKIDMQEDENKQVSYLLPLLLFLACIVGSAWTSPFT